MRRLLFLVVLLLPQAAAAQRSFFWHATSRSGATSLLERGPQKRFMRQEARFGKGFYLAGSRRTALLERPRAESLLRFRAPALKRSALNLRQRSPKAICALGGAGRCTGLVKRGIVGPSLGARLGKRAELAGRPILYRPRPNPGGRSNLFIPGGMATRTRGLRFPMGVDDLIRRPRH